MPFNMKIYRCALKKKGLKYFALEWEGHILNLNTPTKLFFIPKHQQTFGLFSVYNLGLSMVEKSRR